MIRIYKKEENGELSKNYLLVFDTVLTSKTHISVRAAQEFLNKVGWKHWEEMILVNVKNTKFRIGCDDKIGYFIERTSSSPKIEQLLPPKISLKDQLMRDLDNLHSQAKSLLESEKDHAARIFDIVRGFEENLNKILLGFAKINHDFSLDEAKNPWVKFNKRSDL